jgi:GR25 family glycosyltransferase involved in LPS biosynthesis
MSYYKLNNTYENYVNDSLLSQMKHMQNNIYEHYTQNNIYEHYTQNIFDNIPYYYINLDERTDRKDHIENIAKKYNIKNITRIPAISIKSLDDVYLHKNKIDINAYNMLVKQNITKNRLHHYDLTNGSIGCFLSHLECYKKIVESNTPYAIIFEDDIEINCDKNIYDKIISEIEIPQDADIVLLFALIIEKDKDITDKLKKINFFNCLTFYLVTNKGAKKLLDNLNPIKMQIDGQISRLSYDKIINVYFYDDPDFNYKDFNYGSDIQNLDCNECDLTKEIEDYKEKK